MEARQTSRASSECAKGGGPASDPYLSARAWPSEVAMADSEGTRPRAGENTRTTPDDSYTDLCVIIRMLHVHAGQDLASTLHMELYRLCSGHSILNQGLGQALGCLAGPNHAQALLESVLGSAGAAVYSASVRKHRLSPCNVRRAARQPAHKALLFPQGLLRAEGPQGPHSEASISAWAQPPCRRLPPLTTRYGVGRGAPRE